jgi:hypothetical protein
MLNLNLNLKPDTEKKIKQILAQLSDQDIFFQDIINHRISELKKGIVNKGIDLQKFEEKYNLSSEEFYRKFGNGELGDDEDFMVWSGIYEMQQQDRQTLTELE